jgi:SM-20-related protein
MIELANNIHQQGFHLIDNFLPIETANSLSHIANELASNHQFQAAKIGSHDHAVSNQSIRRDQLHWLDEQAETPAIQAYFSIMKTMADTLNQQLFLGLMDFETHFALYPPGAFYKKHVDQFSNKQDRRISCVYYLNENWQASFGGELLLYDKEDNLLTSILPTANRLVCFLSDLPHEVCETTQTRLSIAGWMKSRPLN